jgi:hypothetical protein
MKVFSILLVISVFWMMGCVPAKRTFDTIKISFVKIEPSTAKPKSIKTEDKEDDKEVLPSPIAKKETPPPEIPKKEPLPSPVKKEETQPSEEKVPQKISPSLIENLPATISTAVQLKKGSYEVTTSVTIEPSGTLIITGGTTLVFRQCGLVCYGRILAKGSERTPIIFRGPDGWDNITISDEKAQGIFEHCTISDGLGVEISMGADNRFVVKKGKTIVGGAILYVNGSRGMVSHCKITGNEGKGAIALCMVTEVRIVKNEITDNKEDGILCSDGAPQIMENRIFKNHKSGIVCEGATKARIERNILHANGEAGIAIREKAAPMVILNTSENNIVGADYRGEAQGVFQRNRIKNNQKMGVLCHDKVSPTIEENEVTQNGMLGIFLRKWVKGILRKNKISHHEKAAIFVAENAAPTIEGNYLSHSLIGILIELPAAPVVGKNELDNCKEEKVTVSPTPK